MLIKIELRFYVNYIKILKFNLIIIQQVFFYILYHQATNFLNFHQQKLLLIIIYLNSIKSLMEAYVFSNILYLLLIIIKVFMIIQYLTLMHFKIYFIALNQIFFYYQHLTYIYEQNQEHYQVISPIIFLMLYHAIYHFFILFLMVEILIFLDIIN